MEQYNKLVRDKIPESLDSKGISYEKKLEEKGGFENKIILKGEK